MASSGDLEKVAVELSKVSVKDVAEGDGVKVDADMALDLDAIPLPADKVGEVIELELELDLDLKMEDTPTPLEDKTDGCGQEPSEMNAKAAVEAAEAQQRKKKARHCAFCLVLIPGDVAQLCGGCKRRVYCSKECQKADWSSTKKGPAMGKCFGYGQGHKDWCGLEYGEEDLDWKLVRIEGKGKGIVALRDLQPLYRIMVDGMQIFPDHRDGIFHPSINNLTPIKSKNNLTKWENNSIGSYRDTDRGSVGLRVARVNHSCDPNAAVITDDESYNVLILIADKEIKAGEEITFSYISLMDLTYLYRHPGLVDPELFQGALKRGWLFTCPPSCICKDTNRLAYIFWCKERRDQCEDLELKKKGPILPLVEEIIQMFTKVLNAPPSIMQQVYESACSFGLSDLRNFTTEDRKTTREKTKYYIEKKLEINREIHHPKSFKLERIRATLLMLDEVMENEKVRREAKAAAAEAAARKLKKEQKKAGKKRNK